MYLHLERTSGHHVEGPAPSQSARPAGEKPHWRGEGRGSRGKAGARAVATDALPGLVSSLLAQRRACPPGPRYPGWFTGLAWAVCQCQDQTRICCSTSQPLPWSLAAPQQPACEGGKQEAGCSAFLSAKLAGAGAGVDGSGERGHSEPLHHQTRPPSRTGPPSAALAASDLLDKASLLLPTFMARWALRKGMSPGLTNTYR